MSAGLVYVIVIAVIVLILIEGARDAWLSGRQSNRRPPVEMWRCHFCDSNRRDPRISVATRHSEVRPGLWVQDAHRYCNDSPACIGAAYEWAHELENADLA